MSRRRAPDGRGINKATDDGGTVSFAGGGSGLLKHLNAAGQVYIVDISGMTNAQGLVTCDISGHTFTISDAGAQIGLAVAECFNDWPMGLSDNVVITGWTTSAEHHVKVTGLAGDARR